MEVAARTRSCYPLPLTLGSSGTSLCKPLKSSSSVIASTIISLDGLSRPSVTTLEGSARAAAATYLGWHGW